MRPSLAFIVLLAACSPAPAVPEAEFLGPPGSVAPSLVATPDGAAVMTWLEPAAESRHALRFATRQGGRWSAPRTIVESDSFFVNWADFPSLVVLADGAWIVHWLARVPGGTYAYHVRVAISRDRGATWTTPLILHRDRAAQEHGFVALVPWDDSTAAAVWLDGRDMKPPADPSHESEGDMTLRFTTLTSSGRLGDEARLDARTCECCQTALARTAAGLVAAYRDRSPEEIRDIAVVRQTGGTWTAPALVARDGWHYPGCPVNGPAIAASGDSVAVAWFTGAQGEPRVFVAFSTDGGASWGAPIRVDDGRPLGRVDIEVEAGEGALVTWLETVTGGADVRVRRVVPGDSLRPSRRVAQSTNTRSSGFPRMARVGGDVLVAWTGPDGIRVAAAKL